MDQRCFQKLQCVVAYEVPCKNNEHLNLNLVLGFSFLKGKVHPGTGREGPEVE